jgi:hypothetical protein
MNAIAALRFGFSLTVVLLVGSSVAPRSWAQDRPKLEATVESGGCSAATTSSASTSCVPGAGVADAVENLYSGLDLSGSQTGVLYDQMLPAFNYRALDGTSGAPALSGREWMLMYEHFYDRTAFDPGAYVGETVTVPAGTFEDVFVLHNRADRQKDYWSEAEGLLKVERYAAGDGRLLGAYVLSEKNF